MKWNMLSNSSLKSHLLSFTSCMISYEKYRFISDRLKAWSTIIGLQIQECKCANQIISWNKSFNNVLTSFHAHISILLWEHTDKMTKQTKYENSARENFRNPRTITWFSRTKELHFQCTHHTTGNNGISNWPREARVGVH